MCVEVELFMDSLAEVEVKTRAERFYEKEEYSNCVKVVIICR